METQIKLITYQDDGEHKYLRIDGQVEQDRYVQIIITDVKVDITGLHKHTKEFEEFIKKFNYQQCFNEMIITDAIYEKYIQPYNEWSTKRKLLYPDENLDLWIRQYKNKSLELEIDIRGIENPITIPKTLHGITLDVLYNNEELTQEITIQDINSIILIEDSIATLMHASGRKLLKMGEESYIKFEKTIVKTLDTMIKNVEKAIEQKDDGIYKHEIYRWRRLNFLELPELIKAHNNTAKNIDKNTIEEIKTTAELIYKHSYGLADTEEHKVKLLENLKIVKQALENISNTNNTSSTSNNGE